MNAPDGGISRIMDGIINQVNHTRHIFTILIGLVVIPLSVTVLSILFIAASVLYGVPEDLAQVEGLAESLWIFELALSVIIGFALFMVVIMGFGIRQLILLRRWTQRYREFQDRIAEVDKKLDECLD